MDDPLIGTTLGAYQILSEIGRGGMGIVYRGYQASLNRSVALKVLAAHLAHDKLLVDRFLHEARFTAGLVHPNIITIHEVSETPPYFIAMEYVDGETLTQRIQRDHIIPPARAQEIVTQVAGALDFAHGRGIIHRDIKPSNILLTPTGRAILTDFGIARATEGTRLTQDQSALGTPEYMAPEMVEGETANANSDIYALGVVLFEMVTGRAPFHGETPLATLHQQVYQALPSARQLNPRLSPEIERVLQKALAKQPEKRFQTARDLAEAFSAAVQGKGMPRELGGGIRRAAIWIGLTGFVIALALIALAFGVIQIPTGTPTTKTFPTGTATEIFVARIPTPDNLTIVNSGAGVPTQTPFVITATPQPTLPPTQTLVPSLTPLPTATLVPTTIPPTPVPPTAVPTRRVIRPTATDTPTEIPPPTATPIPRGVWVMQLDAVPPHSADGAQMYFVAHFLNTTDGLAYFNWCVEIFEEGKTNKAFSNTECRPQTIPDNASEQKTLTYRTGCGSYQMRVIWIDTFSERHAITKPDGSTAWGFFSVCP